MPHRQASPSPAPRPRSAPAPLAEAPWVWFSVLVQTCRSVSHLLPQACCVAKIPHTQWCKTTNASLTPERMGWPTDRTPCLEFGWHSGSMMVSKTPEGPASIHVSPSSASSGSRSVGKAGGKEGWEAQRPGSAAACWPTVCYRTPPLWVWGPGSAGEAPPGADDRDPSWQDPLLANRWQAAS